MKDIDRKALYGEAWDLLEKLVELPAGPGNDMGTKEMQACILGIRQVINRQESRREMDLCQHFVDAARAQCAKAMYDVTSGEVYVETAGEEYKVSGEVVASLVEWIGGEKAWKHIHHGMKREKGKVVWNKECIRDSLVQMTPLKLKEQFV